MFVNTKKNTKGNSPWYRITLINSLFLLQAHASNARSHD